MSNTEQDPATLFKPFKSPTSVWDDYRRAEIGLEYLEEIKIGHKSYRTNIEEAARDAILNFLRG